MRIFRVVFVLLSFVPVQAQEWLRYRGPGELLPPQLGGDAGNMADLTVWEFAWEFQREALRPERPTLAPLPDSLLDAVVPPLQAASRAADEELALLSLWGMARIAAHHDRAAKDVRDLVLTSALRRPGPVGEVAALALGFAARNEAVAHKALVALAHDTVDGRALVAAAAVPERTRCFALYGLGLAAEVDARADVQFRVLAAVERLLLPEAVTPPQVRIAALHALTLVHLDAAPNLPGPALRLLEQQWSLEEPTQLMSIRAQVPNAVAAMLGREDGASEVWRERFRTALQNDGTSIGVRRSCAQALGRLCRRYDGAASPDGQYSEALRAVATNNRDGQTQYLALFALGVIGGAENRSWLCDQLAARGRLRHPWLALGLGCGVVLQGQAVDAEFVAVLQRAAQATKDPGLLGGIAVGLGLCGAKDTAPVLRDLLQQNLRKDPAAAALCFALANVEARDATDALRELAMATASPDTAREAMLAYGRLGGEAAHAQLTAWMLDPSLDRTRRYAAAVAQRGQSEPKATAALVRTLGDAASVVELRRLAAFALGSLCDRSARHWSAKLAAAIDYRGCTPALVGAPNGVLRLP